MHPVCLNTIFLHLYTTLPHNLIKDKLMDLIERMLFSHLMQSGIKIYGLVRKCVKLLPFS